MAFSIFVVAKIEILFVPWVPSPIVQDVRSDAIELAILSALIVLGSRHRTALWRVTAA
jgi:hypothetical protein